MSSLEPPQADDPDTSSYSRRNSHSSYRRKPLVKLNLKSLTGRVNNVTEQVGSEKHFSFFSNIDVKRKTQCNKWKAHRKYDDKKEWSRKKLRGSYPQKFVFIADNCSTASSVRGF